MRYSVDKNIALAINAAFEAGKKIIGIYQSNDFNIEQKANLSPLTKADMESNKIILNVLKETGVPVLSEEGLEISKAERVNWKNYWLIDPLDGTREFINRNGEFTINIALMIDNIPIAGVVYAPVLDILYFSSGPSDASKISNGIMEKLVVTYKKNWPSDFLNNENVRIVSSRSHMNQDTKSFIDQFKGKKLLSMGSSLKFMLLAEGKADIYPRLGPTMEWDTAASQAILSAVNKNIYMMDLKTPISYNKECLKNPYFVAY